MSEPAVTIRAQATAVHRAAVNLRDLIAAAKTMRAMAEGEGGQ